MATERKVLNLPEIYRIDRAIRKYFEDNNVKPRELTSIDLTIRKFVIYPRDSIEFGAHMLASL